MKSISSIRILTYGVQDPSEPVAILPSMILNNIENIEELKLKSLSISVDLILLGEQYAEAGLNELIPLRDQMPDTQIMIICNVANAKIIRSWTAQGADDVWLQSEWQTQLLEFGGGRDIQIEPSRVVLEGKETKVIAVASVFSGGGSTYTALMLAKYLRKKHKARVAIWEGVPQGKEKLRTLNYILNDRSAMSGEKFEKLYSEVDGLCFFENTVDDQTLEVVQQEFDYLIYDLGELSCSANELLFFRAHVPLLIGSTAPYRWVETARALREFQHRRQDRVQIVVPFASKECISQQQELNPGRLIHSMPTHQDPLRLEEESSQVIETLLTTILPKPKKGSIRLFNLRR